jgi:hypothetical protein
VAASLQASTQVEPALLAHGALGPAEEHQPLDADDADDDDDVDDDDCDDNDGDDGDDADEDQPVETNADETDVEQQADQVTVLSAFWPELHHHAVA